MRTVVGLLSLASLLACMIAPFLYLRQTLTMEAYKQLLLAGSIAWFAFATLWVSRRKG
jgi:hypothetical protein